MLFTTERVLQPSIESQIREKIHHIRQCGGITNADIERIASYALDIATYADLLHYGEDDTEHPVLEKIIESVATLAFLPGGFEFGEVRFIAVPNYFDIAQSLLYQHREHPNNSNNTNNEA